MHIVDKQTFHVDQVGMDAIGRLGCHLYARIQDQFEVVTETVDEWNRRKKDR